jgi:hypothetical protein
MDDAKKNLMRRHPRQIQFALPQGAPIFANQSGRKLIGRHPSLFESQVNVTIVGGEPP